MLVLLSDVHLTDGSSGTTIDPRAFHKFCQMLKDIIGDPKKSRVEKIEIALLGDIFDLIRSDLWLREENNSKNPIRPWSAATDTDASGWNLQNYAEAIVDRITGHKRNIEAIGYLRDFQSQYKDAKISYLIGNHDWLINRYPSTRQKIANFLGMTQDQNKFPYEQVFEEYRVMARHGDYYDRFNYDGNRDASSLGDAIVIDLLNRFPEAVKNHHILGQDAELVEQLKEIDNVRPLLEIPAWIQGVCNYRPGVEDKVHEVWNSLVKKFFKVKFVKAHDHFGPDMVDFLEMAMRLSSGFSFGRLKEILGSRVVRSLYQRSDDYSKFAYKEAPLKNNQVRYVVYGHTHHAAQVPLDIVPLSPKVIAEKVYFNTGTWRKVFEHTAFDQDSCEFIGWNVMTFVIFYLPEEKEQDRHYEVWSASLGYGR